MNQDSFTTAVLVEQTPQQVFDAINDVRGWWTGEIDGTTDALGAEFTYRYASMHRSTHRVTELVPGRRVVWRVIDGAIHFVRDPREWNGTDIVFEIVPRGTQTEVRFTHVGLVPTLECHDACAGAWSRYVTEGLARHIAARSQPAG